MNHKVHAVVGVLSDDTDPMVTVMKLEKAPQETYADIDNLLDRSNIYNVFTDTGTPSESTNPNTSPMWMHRPYYWQAPRHIELGITVRL